MTDPVTLQYLKSIDDRTGRMETNIETMRIAHEANIETMRIAHNDRIGSLEKTRTQQEGIMVGGGVVVASLAAIVSWTVNHLFRHPLS